jgi:hypothetical protein
VELRDKTKVDVHTGVVVGRRNSDLLIEDEEEAIFVPAENQPSMVRSGC